MVGETADIQAGPVTAGGDFVTHYHGRATVWSDLDVFGKAVKDFTETIRLDPKQKRALKERSFAWEQLGDHQKAKNDLDSLALLKTSQA